jgi:hypothetical protein
MRNESAITYGSRHEPKRCEQTGLTIPECSCPACWARMQARQNARRVVETGNHSAGYGGRR